MVGLSGAGWTLTLLPALGGAIGTLRFQDQDILRPTAEDATDPLESACFPLVPYANRIAGGRFGFGGRDVALPLNFGDHPNTLHGFGWHRPWEVAQAGPDRIRLVHAHDGSNGWPWRYRAEQTMELDENGLRLTLTLVNKAIEPMPAGIGLHPYFVCPPGTRLRFDAQRVWLTDAVQIPDRSAQVGHFGDWASGTSIAEADFVDHSYEGWGGKAMLDTGAHRVTLTAQGARDLHLFHPQGESFCCLEPVTHLPNAFNRPDGIFDVLPAGGTLTLVMRIGVDRG